MKRWRGWSRRRRVLTVFTLVFVLVVPLPLAAYAVSLRLHYTGDPSALARTRNHDALWLGHAWVDGRKTAADVTALAKQLNGTGIRDLYVHAGPLEHDGSLPLAEVSPKARWFTDTLRAAAPGVRVQAWLGDIVLPAKNPGMDLDDPAVRDRVTTSSAAVLDQGFQGIHFDFEPVHSGSAGFLAVLDQVHAITLVKQTELALEVTPPEVDLLMGLPAYYESNPSHWGHAETVAAAVRAARLGLGDSTRQNFGLALYVDFTATPEHWNAYRQGWCSTP